MFDNLKTYNYSKSLVSPEGYGRHESNFLSGDIINGFETVIGTGLQVTVKPGNAIIRSGSGGTASAHLVSLVADFTSTLATADASNPRIDAIVLYVDTSVSLPSGTPTAGNLDGLGVAKLKYVTGAPNANPSAPSTAAIQSSIGSASYPYTVLSTWRVNAGVSALSQDRCTDTRSFAAPTNPRALGRSSFIEAGGVANFTAGTLNGSLTAGTAWISFNGALIPQAFNSLNFTMAASKDRYYYVTLGTSTIQAAADVSNGAARPTLPANSVLLAAVVSSASAITATFDIRKVPTATGSWWEELGRSILTKAGDSITVSNLPARRYLRIIFATSWTGGAINAKIQLNGDTGSNYAYRVSRNGAADGTATSSNNISAISTAAAERIFMTADAVNIPLREKQLQITCTTEGAQGAAAIPNRNELAAKWSNTADQITSVTVFNDGAGDYNSIDSNTCELIVLGHD